MASTADIEKRASEWLAQRDSERWSAQQQRELDAWLDASSAHRVAFLRLAQAWQHIDRLAALPDRPVQPLGHWLAGWRLAAGVMLCLGLATTVALLHQADDVATHSAERGTRRDVELQDGSRLTLNTDTQLRATVDAKQRRVWLDRGEAFFDIRPDAQRPFVIEAGDQRITVLGTQFSVRLDEGHVQVQVLEGRVRVQARKATSPAATQPAVVLGRNEMALAQADQLLVAQKTSQQISNALSWRLGRLVLDEVTLQQAADEFNRYNKKQLVIADPALAQMRIGGSFDVGNVDAFARLLREGFGLKVLEADERINISS